MAQLTDDCFAFSGPLMPLEDMERLIAERVAPIADTETILLSDARHRVLAADVVAPVDLPPFDNSAVDGYAVRHADLNIAGETVLAVAGRITAGARAEAGIRPMQAIRIFTGAPMPPGADTVFMQEDVRVEGDSVVVPPGLSVGANRRFAGEDLCAGTVALTAGTVLDARHIALGAALGLQQVAVRRRLRVAVFSTGDEVVEPGATRGPAVIFDANRYLLRDLLTRAGCTVSDLGILRDDPPTLAVALERAAGDHDLVVTSGGVSTGEADHVRTAVERIGSLVFWRIAIKPGRPVAMGVIRGRAFIGLPGNPVAVFVTFVRVVRPLLMRLSGAEALPWRPMPVVAAFSYNKKKGRREYVRVSLQRRDDGDYDAIKYPQDGAGVITSLTGTDGLIELPDAMTRLEPGMRIGFLSYALLTG
ncbi:MAG TPA: gephyrin-like molybdotransferase Glp [Pseudolabrys sp.]|nr:gephyrin-like molybdotransferase Glp [Pseudolabrys sp.]